MITGPATAPQTSDQGTNVDQGQELSLGPVLDEGAAWPAQKVWIKRSGASDATVIFNGVVR